MRTLIVPILLATTALGVSGCHMCSGPEDYNGPVIRDGIPTLGFKERHNSILSPGTYTSISGPEFINDPSIAPDGYMPSDGEVIESNAGPTLIESSPTTEQELVPVPEPTIAPPQPQPSRPAPSGAMTWRPKRS